VISPLLAGSAGNPVQATSQTITPRTDYDAPYEYLATLVGTCFAADGLGCQWLQARC